MASSRWKYNLPRFNTLLLSFHNGIVLLSRELMTYLSYLPLTNRRWPTPKKANPDKATTPRTGMFLGILLATRGIDEAFVNGWIYFKPDEYTCKSQIIANCAWCGLGFLYFVDLLFIEETRVGPVCGLLPSLVDFSEWDYHNFINKYLIQIQHKFNNKSATSL